MNVYAKPYRHGNVPAAMKETALKLIDEGYDVGLRECARRIGISATAAYRHFENLDALASSVAAIIVYDMVEAIDAEGQLAEERGDSAEQARAAAFVAWAEANHLRFRFAVQRGDFPHEQVRTAPRRPVDHRARRRDPRQSRRDDGQHSAGVAAETQEGSMKKVTIEVWRSFDGVDHPTEEACAKHEAEAWPLRFVGLSVEEVNAALERRDTDLADAFEKAGNQIRALRYEAGELRRAPNRRQADEAPTEPPAEPPSGQAADAADVRLPEGIDP